MEQEKKISDGAEKQSEPLTDEKEAPKTDSDSPTDTLPQEPSSSAFLTAAVPISSLAQRPVPIDPGTQVRGGKLGEESTSMRIVAVRNAVLFPHNVVPFMAGRDLSAEAIEKAAKSAAPIGIISQKDQAQENPEHTDLHTVGTEARILKVIRFPDGTFGAVMQGVRRFRINRYLQVDPTEMTAEVTYLKDDDCDLMDLKLSALARNLKQISSNIGL